MFCNFSFGAKTMLSAVVKLVFASMHMSCGKVSENSGNFAVTTEWSSHVNVRASLPGISVAWLLSCTVHAHNGSCVSYNGRRCL